MTRKNSRRLLQPCAVKNKVKKDLVNLPKAPGLPLEPAELDGDGLAHGVYHDAIIYSPDHSALYLSLKKSISPRTDSIIFLNYGRVLQKNWTNNLIIYRFFQ